MNSQFIGIKFTVLPFSPSCWNIRKKVSNHVWISIFVKWSVKLSDLPVFQRGNHWETIISKSIADSYPGSIHPWCVQAVMCLHGCEVHVSLAPYISALT